MDAAYKSLAMLDAPGSLEKIALPLMMRAAEEDGLVDIRAIRRAAERLPECRLHSYGPKAAHALLREGADVGPGAIGRTPEERRGRKEWGGTCRGRGGAVI